MFDILFHINLFISLIELEHPLKTSQKRRFIKEHTLLYLFISLIEVEHPLKSRTSIHGVGKNKPLLYP